MGETQKAVDTYDRIIDLLQTEWGMTEEVELKNVRKAKSKLLSKLWHESELILINYIGKHPFRVFPMFFIGRNMAY